MKHFLHYGFLFFAFFLTKSISGQSIFISTATELHKTYLTTSCNVTLVGSFSSTPITMLDIAFNPNGNLYGITATSLYIIDTLTAATTFIGTHNTGVTALTSDNNGNMYAATSSGNFYTINVATGAATFIGTMLSGAAGDLAFFDGDLYMADINSELFRINPANPAGGASIGQLNVGAGQVAYGLISTGTTCQNTQFLAGGNGSLFTVNPNTAQTNLLCSFGLAITGLSSPTDYLASDCVLQIDLDYNNNSGAIGFNYNADTVCTTPINVVDNDVFVFSPDVIDSVRVWISGGLSNIGQETLSLLTANNITVIGNGTSTVRLIKSNNNTTYYDYQNALLTLTYQNTATVPAFGTRTISFLAFSDGSVSVPALTNFYLLSQQNLTFSLGADTVLCMGQTLTLNAFVPSATQVIWNNGSTSPTQVIQQNGTYAAIVTNFCGSFSDAINVSFTPLPNPNIGNDTTICNGETLTLNAFTPYATSYVWQDNTTNPTFSVTQTGTYIVSANATCGNVSDTINVFVYTSNLSLNLGNDAILCPNVAVTLNATIPFAANYQWNNNNTNAILTTTQGGTYSVTVTDICNFTISDTIMLTGFVSQLNVNLGNDTTLCSGTLQLLNATNSTALGYLWQDGSTNSTFAVTTTGTYYVTVTDLCGNETDSITIDYINPPTLELGNDTVLCKGRALVLDAYDEFATSYFWQDSTTLPQFVVTKSGLYEVTVTNSCQIVTDQIRIKFVDDELIIGLPTDIFKCVGDTTSFGVDLGSNVSYLWNTGETESYIATDEFGIYTLTVSNGCITVSDNIEVKLSENCCRVLLPDAFSPNGDAYNDVLYAQTSCAITNFELLLFDRWGNIVFKTTNLSEGWNGTFNGKQYSTNVFIYKLTYSDGETTFLKTGNVTLIR
jgi:gliding motility-associated-like protein